MGLKFFRVGLGLGVCALVAWGLPACGGSDNGGGGGSAGTAGTGGSMGGTGGSMGGTGGTGATGATGGTGATAGTGGSTGGTGGSAGGTGGTGGTVTCGTDSCQGTNIGGIVDLPGCCAGANQDKCGLDVAQLATALGSTPPPNPCVEKNQPGTADSECQDLSIGGGASLTGCCIPGKNQCGYLANTIQSPIGPVTLDLGCVDPTSLGVSLDSGAPASCTPDTDGGVADAGGG